MNDGMCKARREFLDDQFSVGSLFDTTPDEARPDQPRLVAELLSFVAESARPRKELRFETIMKRFCEFSTSDINGAISDLLRSGKLFSSTGKARINDGVLLGAKPFSVPR